LKSELMAQTVAVLPVSTVLMHLGRRWINEEVVKGSGAVNLRKSNPDAMHKGHDLWNASLKQVSERKP
jgi:hypothetical protein